MRLGPATQAALFSWIFWLAGSALPSCLGRRISEEAAMPGFQFTERELAFPQ